MRLRETLSVNMPICFSRQRIGEKDGERNRQKDRQTEGEKEKEREDRKESGMKAESNYLNVH